MTTVQLEDPSLVVLVGAAGSGKSTLARRHFAPHEILSSDALRALVAGDEADQAASRTAFAILHRELALRLGAGRMTVVDATNLRATARRPLLARAASAGLRVSAIVLDLAPAVVQARNGGRPRVVDPAVVARHLVAVRDVVDADRLAAEDFDPVVILRTPREVDDVVIVRTAVSPPG